MAIQSVSTTVRVRMPREVLAGLEEWARAHGMERSKAVRTLMWRALACDWKCNCYGSGQCTGACNKR